MTEPFRPVPGRRHRTRDDGVVLVRNNSNEEFPFQGNIAGWNITWRVDGRAYQYAETALDLVAVIDEPATTPAPVIPVPSTQDRGGTVEALQPFAEIADSLKGLPHEDYADDTVVTCKFGRVADFTLTLGDFRRASIAIAAHPTKAPDVIAEAGASAEDQFEIARTAFDKVYLNKNGSIDDALRAALSALPPREAAPDVDDNMVMAACEKFFGPLWSFLEVEMMRDALVAALAAAPKPPQTGE